MVKKKYVEMEVTGGKSCYEVTHTGEQVLKENQLHFPSDNESLLSRLLPEEELRGLLSILADILDTQISIMDENGIFRISPEGKKGPCPRSLLENVGLPVYAVIFWPRGERGGLDLTAIDVTWD